MTLCVNEWSTNTNNVYVRSISFQVGTLGDVYWYHFGCSICWIHDDVYDDVIYHLAANGIIFSPVGCKTSSAMDVCVIFEPASRSDYDNNIPGKDWKESAFIFTSVSPKLMATISICHVYNSGITNFDYPCDCVQQFYHYEDWCGILSPFSGQNHEKNKLQAPPLCCFHSLVHSLTYPPNHLDLHRHIDGLVQERRNSIAYALELRLSCTNPSIWCH